jgi:C-terminal processing protease CtpA/Prc
VTKKALGHDAYVETYGDEAWQLPDGSIRTLDTDYEQPEPTDRRYNGTVYVLIGTGTFSTAAIFAAAVQDSKNALVWGAESGGCATLYGELFSFRLPHSNLSVSVSTKHFIRSGGSHMPAAVIPDRVFSESPQGLGDSELDQVIALVSR